MGGVPTEGIKKGKIERSPRILKVGWEGERGDLILERDKLRKIKERFASCGRKQTWGIYSPKTWLLSNLDQCFLKGEPEDQGHRRAC